MARRSRPQALQAITMRVWKMHSLTEKHLAYRPSTWAYGSPAKKFLRGGCCRRYWTAKAERGERERARRREEEKSSTANVLTEPPNSREGGWKVLST